MMRCNARAQIHLADKTGQSGLNPTAPQILGLNYFSESHEDWISVATSVASLPPA